MAETSANPASSSPAVNTIVLDGQFHEKPFRAISGWLMLPAARNQEPGVGLLAIPCMLLFILSLVGYFVISPNESRALVLFGHYRGTVRAIGLHWTNPFTIKRRVTLRVRTFETGSQQTAALKDPMGKVLQEGTRTRHPIKVNDLDGNPVEISAVVVWRVVDTAEALFAVDNYENYVEIQSEAALRNLASHYHYDSPEPGGTSLRGSTDLIGQRLKEELDGRLRGAGVEVMESRISSLSYAPEIAAAMLQRQQATAVVAARQKIVEGAVGMVTPEQKAEMVTNLLVVLVSERGAQPVVATGT
ncbi:MAG: SPFH domain-containing protein [Proteobacteria bacterium]|nr:SPFH domain-containing protein [Pseudomonadota bacterium]